MSALAARLADFVWLVPALPLAAAALTGGRILLGRAHGDGAEPLTARLGELAALTGLLLLLALDALAIAGGGGHLEGGAGLEALIEAGDVESLLAGQAE